MPLPQTPAHPDPFDAWLADAWRAHTASAGDDDFARDLVGAGTRVVSHATAGAWVRLLAHVLGEHRGEWHRGLRALDALAARLGPEPEDGPRPIAIAREALAAASGVEDDLPALGPVPDLADAPGDPGAGAATPEVDALLLSDEERAAAWAGAAAMLTGRGDLGRATALFLAALEAGEAGLPDGSPALRAIAVAGNNLAAALESHAPREPEATAAMLVAAEAACRAWRRAGGWLEHERAEHRWSRSLLAAGRAEHAVRHAQAALALCDAHEADAFERFSCEAALSLACRAAGRNGDAALARVRALAAHEAVPEADRPWCAADLAALGAAGSG